MKGHWWDVKYRAENQIAWSSKLILAISVDVISKLTKALKHFIAYFYGLESLFSRSY